MVPDLTTCDACGRMVIVLSWSPIYEDAASQLIDVDDSHTLQISCKIDCPTCGTRIQNITPTVDSNLG